MKLLISVQDASEAEIALTGGADMIDVKQPSRGALGCPDGDTIVAVVKAVRGRVPVSAALGEIFHDDEREANESIVAASQLNGLQFAKYGLSHAMRDPDWRGCWIAAVSKLPRGTRPVAVVYADWKTCAAPSPSEVLEAAERTDCAAVLVDTFDKSRGGLLHQISLADLSAILRDAKSQHLLTVVGGSLDQGAIAQVAPLFPDVIAVRTAACRGNRTGPVERANVHRLKKFLTDEFVTPSFGNREKLLDLPYNLG